MARVQDQLRRTNRTIKIVERARTRVLSCKKRVACNAVPKSPAFRLGEYAIPLETRAAQHAICPHGLNLRYEITQAV